MMSRLFEGVQVGVWAEVSAAAFMVLFLGLLVWVYLPQRRGYYDAEGRLPLEDEIE